jgi:hypothetical protein
MDKSIENAIFREISLKIERKIQLNVEKIDGYTDSER